MRASSRSNQLSSFMMYCEFKTFCSLPRPSPLDVCRSPTDHLLGIALRAGYRNLRRTFIQLPPVCVPANCWSPSRLAVGDDPLELNDPVSLRLPYPAIVHPTPLSSPMSHTNPPVCVCTEYGVLCRPHSTVTSSVSVRADVMSSTLPLLVVVVLTLTRIIKSVVTGQAPVTLKLRNNPGKNTNKPKVVHAYITADAIYAFTRNI